MRASRVVPAMFIDLYRLYCEYQFTPRQRRDPLLYWPRALFLICRLLAVGSISTPVVT